MAVSRGAVRVLGVVCLRDLEELLVNLLQGIDSFLKLDVVCRKLSLGDAQS